MLNYSQGKEQETVLSYFGEDRFEITFLDCGSNDGITLSNTYALSERGDGGVCVEPSPSAFKKLKSIYSGNDAIQCINLAVSNYTGKVKMWDSGTHLNKGDTSLLSTLNEKDYQKWKATTDFIEVNVDVVDVKELLARCKYSRFDFITIDAEGNDLIILRQLNLNELQCDCICVEHNGDTAALEEIRNICKSYGLKKELLLNGENVILAR